MEQIDPTGGHQLLLELDHAVVWLARRGGEFLSRRVAFYGQKVQQVHRPAENFHIAVHLIVRVDTHDVTQQGPDLLGDQRLQQKAVNRITFVDRVGDNGFQDVDAIYRHGSILDGVRGKQGHQQFDHFDVDDLLQGNVGVLDQRAEGKETVA